MLSLTSYGAVRVFRNRAYRIYTEGNFVSLIGTWVQRVATGWLAWDLTHSGAWLGAVAAAELLPSIVLGPFGGAAADRLDRFRLIVWAQSLMAVVAFVLGWATLHGWVDIWTLFGLTVVNGCLQSFNQASRLSLVRSLVQREDLPAAIAVNSVLWNSARFVGPVCAGFLIVVFEIGWSFVANGLSFLAFVAAMYVLRHDIPRGGVTSGGPILKQIAEGIAYVARHEGMRPLMLMLFIGAVFSRPFAELLPGISDAVFHRGAEGLATLTSATGIGAVIAGVWLAQAAKFGRLTLLALNSNALLALALLVLAATDSFYVGVAATAAAGLCMTVNGVANQSIVQYASAPEMMGRVLSIYGLSFRAGPALGALAMGTASEWFGLQIPVAVGAVVCLVAWLWLVRRQGRIAAAMGEGHDPSNPKTEEPAPS
ncbi:MAG: MFS transporter [Alphaproteobacteria bacterium]|nr:MFS transporter [Alphaproteobacteria bacterium]MCB9930745.1 MFS transporter [Alphaproteobacteria bacterium]